MKKFIILVILLLTLVNATTEAPIKCATSDTIEVEKAKFIPAYERIRMFEGYYAHQPHDKGGETYGGVTRNFNTNWYGWRYIDQHRNKAKNRKLSQNYIVPEAEFWVQDYYLDVWVKEDFGEIIDQNAANYAFDFRINSHHSGIFLIQRVLNEMGQKVEITGVMDENTAKAINNVDPDSFLLKVRNARYKLYNIIVKKDTTQRKFYRNWIDRAKIIKSPIHGNEII